MQIFVDADACPVVGIVEKVAKEHSVPNLTEPVGSFFTFLGFLSLFQFLSLCNELFGSFDAFLFLFL